jgi:hypothetical protein
MSVLAFVLGELKQGQIAHFDTGKAFCSFKIRHNIHELLPEIYTHYPLIHLATRASFQSAKQGPTYKYGRRAYKEIQKLAETDRAEREMPQS